MVLKAATTMLPEQNKLYPLMPIMVSLNPHFVVGLRCLRWGQVGPSHLCKPQVLHPELVPSHLIQEQWKARFARLRLRRHESCTLLWL